MSISYKKLLSIGGLSILIVSMLSGCGKTVKYSGSNFDEFISSQVEISQNMGEKVKGAVNGDFYENIDGSTQSIRDAIAAARKAGTRSLPEEIKVNEEQDERIGNGQIVNTVQATYLGDSYELTRYMGDKFVIGAWEYKKIFNGEESKIYDNYIRYIVKIENEFTPVYGDKKYNNTNLSSLSDIAKNNYLAIYNLGETYMVSIGEYNENSQILTHRLVFLNAKVNHLMKGKYSDILEVFEPMIEDKNVPDDWNLLITYENNNGVKVTTDNLLDEDYGIHVTPIEPEPTNTPQPANDPVVSVNPEGNEGQGELPIDVPNENINNEPPIDSGTSTESSNKNEDGEDNPVKSDDPIIILPN